MSILEQLEKDTLDSITIEMLDSLEYGEATIEMHTDAVKEGMKVLIHDDLLATGGSAFAASALIEKSGGKVAGFNFLVSLDFLKGQEKLVKISDNIINLVNY